MYLCTRNYDLKRGGTFETAKAGTFHSVTAGTSIPLFTYKDGVARVEWMLYPDGRYFADEDGFGMEDNDEVNINAYIDTECRVLVKFQNMEGKSLFNEALKKLEELKKV
jgi:hypothetical protein